uniref:C2H2-type domain-containing protein n=1 Tax=Strongyloides venezuelensis TaxID=75913 RepID=A0A0K0F7X7_STRVS
MTAFIDISPQTSNNCSGDKAKKFCFFCNRVLDINETLKEHIAWHLKYKPIKCNTCNNAFESQRFFESHRRKALREGKVPCAQGYSNYENIWIEGMVGMMTKYSQNIGRNIIGKRMLKNCKVFMVDEIGGYMCDILSGQPIEDKAVIRSVSDFLAKESTSSLLFEQTMKNFITIFGSIIKRREKNKSKGTEKFSSRETEDLYVTFDCDISNVRNIERKDIKVSNRSIESENTNPKRNYITRKTPKETLYCFIDASRLDDSEFKALESIKDSCFVCGDNYRYGNLKIRHIIEKHMDLGCFQPFSCRLCSGSDKKDILFASVDLFRKHFRTEHLDEDYKSSSKDRKNPLDEIIVVDDKHHSFVNKYNNMFSKCFRQKNKRKCSTDERSSYKKPKIIEMDGKNDDTSQTKDGDSSDLLGDILRDIKRTSRPDKVEVPKANNKQNAHKSQDLIKNVKHISSKGDLNISENNTDKSSNLHNKFIYISSEKEHVNKQKCATDDIIKGNELLPKRKEVSNSLQVETLQINNCSKLKSVNNELNTFKDRKVPLKSTSKTNKIIKREINDQKKSPSLRRKSTIIYNGYPYCIQRCDNKCESCDKPVIPKFKKIIRCENKPWHLNFKTPFWYLLSSRHVDNLLVSTNMAVSCQLCPKEFAKSGCGMIRHVVKEHLSLKGFLLKCLLCKLETNNITQLAYHWGLAHNSSGPSFFNNLIWRCPSISIEYPDNYSIQVNKESALKIEKYVKKFIKCFPLMKTQLSDEK